MKITLRIDNNNHILWLWIILAAACLSVIGIILPGVGHFFSLIFLVVALAGIVLLIINRHHFGIKPAKELIEAAETLSQKDIVDLKVGLADLSQGNLSTRLSIHTNLLKTSMQGELEALVGGMNQMIEQLRLTAIEFNNLTEIPCLRLCYVGADSFLEGQKCGEVLGAVMGGRGQVAISSGSFQHSGQELRRKGFESMLRQKYSEIEIVESRDCNEDSEKAFKQTIETLERFPKLAGIYVNNGATPPGVARAVKEAGRAGQVKIVVHDMTDNTMKFLAEGVISATLGQDPFAQGHDPLIHLYNHLAGGWAPQVPRLLTQMDVVTRDNYRDFWQEGRGIIQSQSALKRLAEPLPNSNNRELKLVMLGRDDSDFWTPVGEGSRTAAEKLKKLNCQAEWIVPEESHKAHTFITSEFSEAFEKCIEDKVDGIAMVSADNAMIPLINKAVKNGIPVIISNSEPASLRSLIFTITKQANTLMEMSEGLAASTYETSVAIEQINEAINGMSEGVVAQNEGVTRTRETLDSLLTNIDQVNREAEKSAKATEETAKAVTTGTDAMKESLRSMKAIESSVGETWEIVQQLGKHSDQIDSIIDLIDDIASRVNILSLNAAIEATRAGEFGSGFMVVANEIRKLAKNTAEATKQVTELVYAVKSSIGQVEKVMTAGLKRVKKSAEVTDLASGSLSEIRNLVEVDQQRLQKISTSIAEMQQFSHQVGTAMDSVAAVSEKNASAVEAVNISTSEMQSQIKETTAMAQKLEHLAQSEQEMLAKFTVSISDGA